MLYYRKSKSAGFYGTECWVTYTIDCYGHQVIEQSNLTEQECIDQGAFKVFDTTETVVKREPWDGDDWALERRQMDYM